ncbi:hypothetical protein, partial [Marinobacter sp. VGCF2001]|uniref:hypothetical protein n=1 Tax=Marinobacter sp. VGCF2001 TaxID=3417189 RepID=UPI003CED6AB9
EAMDGRREAHREVLVAVSGEQARTIDRSLEILVWAIRRGQKPPKSLTIMRFDCTKRTFEKFIRKRDRVFTLSRFFAT